MNNTNTPCYVCAFAASLGSSASSVVRFTSGCSSVFVSQMIDITRTTGFNASGGLTNLGNTFAVSLEPLTFGLLGSALLGAG